MKPPWGSAGYLNAYFDIAYVSLFNSENPSAPPTRPLGACPPIVVLGGGVAGIVTATHLSRRLTRGKLADILLVDHNLAHVWKPMLHTFAAGTANYTNENISFISHAKRNHFRYWPGELSGLSRSRKTVELGSVSMPDGGKASRQVVFLRYIDSCGRQPRERFWNTRRH
jgi:hypothetical protein